MGGVNGKRELIARLYRALNRLYGRLGTPLHELFGVGASRYEYEELLGVSPELAGKLARTSAALSCRNWNHQRFVRRFGLDCVQRSVCWSNFPDELVQLQRESKPVILLGWHSGVPYGLAAGLAQQGLQALFCVGPKPPFVVPEGLTFVATSGGDLARAEALHKTLLSLRAGGTIYMVADAPTSSENRVTMWGRAVSLAPGIGMLAKVTGATVIPVVSRWRENGGVELVCGESLPECRSEAELYQQIGLWFEQRFRSHPEELEQKYMMRWLYCAGDPGQSTER
ncbi:MAG: hypothetical protein KC800_15715 [Candidatus Eremiobacteraeota bacterium]|nr:hypothetical protein [Candidatus Eremiobacteraeota bacterium]